MGEGEGGGGAISNHCGIPATVAKVCKSRGKNGEKLEKGGRACK